MAGCINCAGKKSQFFYNTIGKCKMNPQQATTGGATEYLVPLGLEPKPYTRIGRRNF